MFQRAVKIIVAAAMVAAVAGCAGPKKNVKKRPLQPISSLATRRGVQNDGVVMREVKAAGKATWNGSVWVVKELLSPLDALRKGMINLFGVTTEETVVQRNLPPQGFKQQ